MIEESLNKKFKKSPGPDDFDLVNTTSTLENLHLVCEMCLKTFDSNVPLRQHILEHHCHLPELPLDENVKKSYGVCTQNHNSFIFCALNSLLLVERLLK